MKHLLIIALLCGIGFVFGSEAYAKGKPAAKSWSGILCDNMCAKKMKGDMTKCAGHTKACMSDEMCAKSGFGLMVDGKFYKFDKKGNDLASAWLGSTSKTKDMQVTVSGTMSGTTIKVTDLKDKM